MTCIAHHRRMLGRSLLLLAIILTVLCSQYNAFTLLDGTNVLTRLVRNDNKIYRKTSKLRMSSQKAVNGDHAVPRQAYKIRYTKKLDLNVISKMLSQASTGSKTALNWRQKMDQLWAKSDIENLLKSRLEAIEAGKKRFAWVQHQIYSNNLGALSEHDELKLLWQDEKLRQAIERAATQTGETNVWQSHNFAITPPSKSWLYHVQLTAVDVKNKNAIVGFCEVAMLEKPSDENNGASNGESSNKSEHTSMLTQSGDKLFTPAITNLAVKPEYRRQGIAQQLLATAAKYTQMYYSTGNDKINGDCGSLGLYVEQDNAAAVALYKKMNYEIVHEAEGGDQLGPMWYMECKFKTNKKNAINGEVNGVNGTATDNSVGSGSPMSSTAPDSKEIDMQSSKSANKTADNR